MIGAAPSGVPLPEPGPARAADGLVSPQASGPTAAAAPAAAVATTLPAGPGALPSETAAPQAAEEAPADTADDSADAAGGSGPDQATAAAPTTGAPQAAAAPEAEPAVPTTTAADAAAEAIDDDSQDVSAGPGVSAAGCRRVDPFASAAGGGGARGVHALGFAGLDGSPGSLSGYAGCALVVNFFASWCAPCVAEMPDFEEFWRLHGDRVAVLGLARRDAVEDSARMVADTGVTYPVGADSAALFEVFDGLGMPTTVFVSPDGAVADVYSGLMTPDLIVEFAERHFGPLG